MQKINDRWFRIRPYRSEDEPKVLSLWEAAFDKELPFAHWRWKYFDNPYSTDVMVCVSRDNGRIVAMYGGLTYPAVCDKMSISVTHIMDVMSHPEYRGLPYIKTAKAFFDHIQSSSDSLFLFGFPGEKALIVGKRLMKYQVLKNQISYLRASLDDLDTSVISENDQLHRADTADNSFDELWGNCRNFFPLILQRDKSYVRWRFLEHPDHRYEVWKYFKGREVSIMGYAALRVEDKKAVIVDLLVPPEFNATCNFVSLLGRSLRERGIETIESWLASSHFITSDLTSLGFRSYSEPLGITAAIRAFDHSPPVEWISQNFYYTMADGDLF